MSTDFRRLLQRACRRYYCVTPSNAGHNPAASRNAPVSPLKKAVFARKSGQRTHISQPYDALLSTSQTTLASPYLKNDSRSGMSIDHGLDTGTFGTFRNSGRALNSSLVETQRENSAVSKVL
jgi:hypothetical protein